MSNDSDVGISVLQEQTEKAYVPQVVSLGNLHPDQERVRKYDQFKSILLVHTHPYRAQGILHDQETRSKTDFKQLVKDIGDQKCIEEWYHKLFDHVDRGCLGLGGKMKDQAETAHSKHVHQDIGGKMKDQAKTLATEAETAHSKHVHQDIEGKMKDQAKTLAAEAETLRVMMARDGLFVLQFLRELPGSTTSSFSPGPAYNVARFFRANLPAFAVQEDIMKLKNQIPFFILEKILKWESETFTEMIPIYQKKGKSAVKNYILQDLILQWEAGSDDLISILRHAWHILSPFIYVGNRQQSHESLDQNSHLLGFVYKNIITSSPNAEGCSNGNRRYKKTDLKRAVELQKRGVKFAALEKQYLDQIRYDDATCTFCLPPIKIDGRTDAFLRNLVAYEIREDSRHDVSNENGPPVRPLVCYIYLMQQLIKAAEDVEVLRNGGIIESHLRTDQEVAEVWKWDGIVAEALPEGAFQSIDNAIDGVMRFYNSKYRIFMLRVMFRILFGDFKKRYLSSPWIAIALIAACILFVIAILQTIIAWDQLHDSNMYLIWYSYTANYSRLRSTSLESE